MPNEFDDVMPNSQKIGGPRCIGLPNKKWDEVHSTSGSYVHMTLNGNRMYPHLETAYIEKLLPASTGFVVEHNLDSDIVLAQIYDINKTNVEPDNIVVLDRNTIKITFVVPHEGSVIVYKGL